MPTPTTLSEVSICNLALQDVGRGLAITALDENSQAARVCRLRYPGIRGHDTCSPPLGARLEQRRLICIPRCRFAPRRAVRDGAAEGPLEAFDEILVAQG